MKIGIFTEVYKPVINGVVNSIIGFKKGLEEQGHEVYIFCPTYRNHQDDLGDANIVHMKSIPIPRGSGYHFILPPNREIKDIVDGLDLIHVHHPFNIGSMAVALAKELGKPLVFTNHSQYEQFSHYVPLPKAIVNRVIRHKLKNFMVHPDLTIAPAEGVAPYIRGYNPAIAIDIVPNGIDVDRFGNGTSFTKRQELATQLGIEEHHKVLIYTGRLSAEKNIAFLMQAFRKMSSKDGDLRLLLVGGGPQMQELTDMSHKLGINDQVTITDYVPYEDMHHYLSLAHVYVTTSKSEVHPLTLLEGMAAGLPAVIIKATGTGEIIEHGINGLVAEDNVDHFVEYVEKLLQDHQLREKLSRGARKSAQKYSFKEMSKLMAKAHTRAIEIYRQKKN